eukprot:scpid18540/ scgid22779/ 
MAANQEISRHCTLPLEVLDRLVTPVVHDCQGCDGELKFSSGFLARSWPMRVVSDINLARLMVEEPEFALPLTAAAIADCSPGVQQKFLSEQVKPFAQQCVDSLQKHATRWHKFPLLFALGGDSVHNHFFWRSVFRVLGRPVTVPEPSPPARSFKENYSDVYAMLVNTALSLKDPDQLLAAAVQHGILSSRNYLLGGTQWFLEFVILAIVAAGESGIRHWLQNWPVSDVMMAEVKSIAEGSTGNCLSPDKTPETWKWFVKHVFAIPVNNVVAERQFNIAQLYVHPNESELSKQATHLFVENIIHKTANTELSKKTRRKTTPGMTSTMAKNISRQMKEYSATVTPERLAAAREQVKNIRSKTAARTKTAAEVYSDSLHCHRQRPDHEKNMTEMESEARTRSVDYERRAPRQPRQSATQPAETPEA